MLCSVIPQLCPSIGRSPLRNWSLITGRGGYKMGGGAREVLPLQKGGGGAGKVLAALKGGAQKVLG